MKGACCLVGGLAIALGVAAGPCEARSASVRAAFAAAHPCPSTGAVTRTCQGFVVDHVVPLCVGGPDAVWNMAWQSREDAVRKDAVERRVCRWLSGR